MQSQQVFKPLLMPVIAVFPTFLKVAMEVWFYLDKCRFDILTI